MKYNVGSLSHEEAMNQFQLVLAYKYSMTSYTVDQIPKEKKMRQAKERQNQYSQNNKSEIARNGKVQ